MDSPIEPFIKYFCLIKKRMSNYSTNAEEFCRVVAGGDFFEGAW